MTSYSYSEAMQEAKGTRQLETQSLSLKFIDWSATTALIGHGYQPSHHWTMYITDDWIMNTISSPMECLGQLLIC